MEVEEEAILHGEEVGGEEEAEADQLCMEAEVWEGKIVGKKKIVGKEKIGGRDIIGTIIEEDIILTYLIPTIITTHIPIIIMIIFLIIFLLYVTDKIHHIIPDVILNYV